MVSRWHAEEVSLVRDSCLCGYDLVQESGKTRGIAEFLGAGAVPCLASEKETVSLEIFLRI